MGAEQDDPFAARREEMERLFHSLPAAGTADYWRRIEQATVESALPLEVLARCVREREQAGERIDAHRIYPVIFGRIMRAIEHRMAARTRASASRQRLELAEEMVQECYTKVWEELSGTKHTWFMENFAHRLDRVMSHVEHSFMERNGFWIRRGVETPTRVPAREQDSLGKLIAPGEQLTFAETISDPAAENAFERVELEADIAALKATLKPEDLVLIQGMMWEGLTQEQIAAQLGITDKTVRNRLKRILAWMRRYYEGGGEEGDDGE
ncbi:MAG: RNA polymerase sigma factor [Ktedonobacterales bacterium]